jgi:hypothetical protein
VPPPVIGTVEDVYSVLMNFRLRIHRRPPQPGVRRSPTTREEGRELTSTARRDAAAAPAREVVVALDDGELRGLRKDFADCSVAEFDWIDGARVFCAGRAEVLDDLRLGTRVGG